MARPTKITEDHVKYLDEYIEICWDEWEQILKSQHSSEKWSWESWDYRLSVNLPTYSWLLLYYDKKDKSLFVWKDTLIEWRKKWETDNCDEIFERFSKSLQRLLLLQEDMLVNWGVSGRYSPVLSKLMLSSNHWYKESEKKEVELSWTLNLAEFFNKKEKDNLIK